MRIKAFRAFSSTARQIRVKGQIRLCAHAQLQKRKIPAVSVQAVHTLERFWSIVWKLVDQRKYIHSKLVQRYIQHLPLQNNNA